MATHDNTPNKLVRLAGVSLAPLRMPTKEEREASAATMGTTYMEHPPSLVEGEWLYLCGWKASNNQEWLKKNNVGFMVNATNKDQEFDGEYLQVKVLDTANQNFRIHFNTVFEFLERGRDAWEKDGIRTVVHCWAGISRSASLVIAYKMRKHALSQTDASLEVRSLHKCACPNLDFVGQLYYYQMDGKDDPRNWTFVER